MMARLGDIATYINGYAFKPSDWSDSGVPIIRIQDLTGNSYQANRYSGEYAKKYEVLPGDVLISFKANCASTQFWYAVSICCFLRSACSSGSLLTLTFPIGAT